MKKLLLFATAVAIAALTSCGGGGKTDSATDSTKTKDTTAKATVSSGKYKIKSGILNQTMTTMGMTMKVNIYFDDFGSKECMETKGEMDMGMGGKVTTANNINLIKDGYTYDINLLNKAGTKMKIPTTGPKKDVDFNNLTEDLMKQMKITKLGTEDVMGKTCDKYSMNDATTSMKGTYWVWNGIPLKTEIDIAGVKATTTTTKIDESAVILADKFEIPAGIKITDLGK
jgi:hypothetical protein